MSAALDSQEWSSSVDKRHFAALSATKYMH